MDVGNEAIKNKQVFCSENRFESLSDWHKTFAVSVHVAF